MIIRVDDVSPNTDMYELNLTAEFLYKELNAEIWYCVTLFSRSSFLGSVYPDLPMRGRELEYFTTINNVMANYKFPSFVKVASHGLLHVEHGKLDEQAQMMSIFTSCSFLNTNIFVPPFMSFNQTTLNICEDKGIIIIHPEKWRSMETEKFDASHSHWYFHPWRMELSQVKEWINASKIIA